MKDMSFEATPFGSLGTISRDERRRYLTQLGKLPTHIKDVVYNLGTASFLRGLTKQLKMPVDQAPQLAFAVLRVAVGEIELAKLGATLSSELKLPNDKAQAIAKEIEKELFTPVMMELNEWLERQKKQQAGQKTSNPGVSNVIDLKK